MTDEYRLPTEEEVEASGTGAWVNEALRVHDRKQEKLANMLSQEKEAVRREKEKLAQMWATPPDTEAEQVPKGPDLFASERERGVQAKKGLASMFGDELDSKRAEEDQLRNIFGAPPSSGGGKKKPRR